MALAARQWCDVVAAAHPWQLRLPRRCATSQTPGHLRSRARRCLPRPPAEDDGAATPVPVVYQLLSCSLSSTWSRLYGPAFRRTECLRDVQGGRQGWRRRLSKLSCAGWLPHDRGCVSGLPRSRCRASASCRLITGDEGSPTLPCRPLWTSSVRPADQPVGWSWIWRAIAQMKPTISRAIAVVTTTLALPAAIRCR